MFRGPRTFLIFILILLSGIVAYRFYQYVILHNFTVISHTSCDVTRDSCFVMDCSPEEDGADCDIEPYEKVDIMAYEAPQCLLEHTCELFSCDGKASCSITFCSEETLQEGEVCAVIEIPEPVVEEGATEEDASVDTEEPAL